MIPYLRAANVKDGRLDLTDVKTMNFTPAEQQVFALRPGDVLVTEGSGSLRAVGASSVWSGEIPGTVCFQNTLLRLRPRPMTDARFLAWWCRYAFADGLLASAATGANIFHVSADRVRALPVKYLPLPSQRAIADYLDNETVRIDALIGKKRHLVELLDERLPIQLHDAAVGKNHPSASRKTVTGGWFDSIPDHWEVRPLKSLTSFVNGMAFRPDEWAETGLPIIRIENLNGGDDFNFTDRNVDEGLKVRAGDLLFGWSGNRGTSFGPFRWERTGTFALNQHIFRLPAPGVNRDWLYWALRAATPYVEELAHGIIGMVHITKNKLGGIRLPVPPADEQREIADHLNTLDAKHRRLRGYLDQQLAILTERRQALITAAVTGELTIPGVTA